MRVGLKQILLLFIFCTSMFCVKASDFFNSWLPIRVKVYDAFSTNQDSAFALISDFLQTAKNNDNRREIFEAYLIEADLHTSNIDSENALECLRLAEMHIDRNNLEEQTKLKMTYAWYYDYVHALPEAVNYYTEVYELAVKLLDEKLKSSVALNLGGILVESGQLELAINYLKEALATRLENLSNVSDSLRVSTAYSSLGYAFYYNNDYENAFKCYDNAALFSKDHDEGKYFRCLLHAADCATTLNDVESASKYFERLNQYTDLFSINRHYVSYHLNYGRFLVAKNNIDSAIIYYKKAIDYVEENALDVSAKKDVYKNMHMAFLKQGNYINAYKYLNLYASLEDSLHTARNQQNLQRSFALFDVKKKNSRIEDLSQAIQDSEYVINSNKVLLRIGMGLLAIFAIIGLYYYLKKREKEKYTSILETKVEAATRALSVANAELLATNKQLLQKNDEKTVLLREIHHRVKNNMQMVVSIIRVERSMDERIGPEELLQKLENRIHSISEIHEKLYKPSGTDYKFINAKEFFDDVAYQIFKVFSPPSNGKFSLKCSIESFTLPFDKVIQLGIILNELFANTFKYGFVDKTEGEVEITLKHITDNTAKFIYRDNGIGFPESSLKRDKEKGFGKQIVDLLIGQLSGEQKRYNSNGAVVEVEFLIND